MRPKINLRQAMANVSENIAADLTLSELVKAYCVVKFDGADLRMRKWLDAFGNESAWTLSTRDISLAAEAMMQSGLYKASTVNRDTSTLGTIYKWAIRRIAFRGRMLADSARFEQATFNVLTTGNVDGVVAKRAA